MKYKSEGNKALVQPAKGTARIAVSISVCGAMRAGGPDSKNRELPPSSSSVRTPPAPKRRRNSRSGKRELQPGPSDVRSPQKAPRRRLGKMNHAGEERLSRFISKPTAATWDRIERAFQHRLYLIQTNLLGEPSKPSSCEFVVLGATGNVYTVRLDRLPSCTCPDFLDRGNACKHILFVMLRVLKLPPDDSRVWQKALLSSELEDLLDLSRINGEVLASRRVRDRFREIAGSSRGAEQQNATVQRDLGGDCPVCYEVMEEGSRQEDVVFCKACGNNVHADCFAKWSKIKASEIVTCIYCRAPWKEGEEDGGHLKMADNNIRDYVNLAAYSHVHRTGDTSLRALYPDTYSLIRRRRP